MLNESGGGGREANLNLFLVTMKNKGKKNSLIGQWSHLKILQVSQQNFNSEGEEPLPLYACAALSFHKKPRR